MNLEMLEPFCSGYIEKMLKPWSRGEFTYASDGFCVVRVPRMADAPEIPNPVNAEAIFNVTPEPTEGFIALPSIEEIGELKDCPKCHYVKPIGIHVCPACGFAPERKSDVEIADGNLVQLKGGKAPVDMATKQIWYSALIWIAKDRGYKPNKKSGLYEAGKVPAAAVEDTQPVTAGAPA